MSNPPQGLMRYPGITSIKQGSYILSHGIEPGAFTLTFPAQKNFAVKFGAVQLTYGGDTITWPDCRMDLASLKSSSSGQMMTVRILDRRWRWQFGEISGSYNYRGPDGTIEAKSEKTPQELAKLLLKAMGETRFDVNQLPNNVFPQVEWDYSNPAEELANLCDSLGCRVVLRLDNTVRICMLGTGAELPTGYVTGGGYGFDPQEMPDSIKIVCAPTQFQCRLTLEAVGQDLDGFLEAEADSKIVPIDDLSYNPMGQGVANGWAGQNPDSFQALIGGNQLSARIRAQAFRTVFRWYRVKDFPNGGLELPGYGKLTDIRQILPLSDSLLVAESEDPRKRPLPDKAFVEGRYARRYSDPITHTNTPANTRYDGSFTFNAETGVIEFGEPMFRWVHTDEDLLAPDGSTIVGRGSNCYFPASLTVTCTFSVRDYDKRGIERHTVERKITNDKFRTGPKIVLRDDLQLNKRISYGPYPQGDYGISSIDLLTDVMESQPVETVSQIVTNEETIETRAKYYLDAEYESLRPKESLSYSYAKIMKIDLDGQIQQVSWTVGEQGAATEASKNSDFNLAVPSYQQLRDAAWVRNRRKEAAVSTAKKK